MKEPIIFSGKDIEKTSLNFLELRQKGLDDIQKRSGKIWTDYNSHDPGVTILEQICYALTDISLRTSHNINDLLTPENKKSANPKKNAFYAPSQIYRTHPVTILDFKKILLDEFNDIQNIWIKTTDNSGFEEKLVVTERIEILPKLIFNSYKEEFDRLPNIKKDVEKFISEIRNVGEDVEEICILKPKNVTVEIDIHLAPQKNIETTLANLFLALFEYIYRPIRRYTLPEMLDDGHTISDVFSGPRLLNGFIKDESLKKRITVIDRQEIQQILSKVENMYKCEVTKLHFDDQQNKEFLKVEGTEYFHLLKDGNSRSITVESCERIYEHMTVLINNKEVDLSTQDKHKIHHLFYELWAKKYRQYPASDSQNYNFRQRLKGTAHKLEDYYSIQNHFPIIYGIGKDGLRKTAPLERHAKAKQLKAYLLFFEQNLANHLSQISHIEEFFNIDFKNAKKQTYFSQDLSNVPNIEAVHPHPVFKLEACVYYKESRRLYVEAEIDQKSLMDLDPEKQQTLLERRITERKLFNDYLKNTKNRMFPRELKFGSSEIQNYLDMLHRLKFAWLAEQTYKDFGSSVVLSFAILMKVEKKYFTPIVFADAFIHHLKRMLTVIGKEDILEDLFEKMKEIDWSNKIDKTRLSAFIKLCESVLSRMKEPGFFDRKNRVYNHLLARFGEDLNSLPWDVSNQLDPDFSEEKLKNELLFRKSDYLLNIENLSAERIKGESFFVDNEEDKTKRNMSGLENIILAKTGILPRRNRTLDKTAESGGEETFYIVDHILLRDILNNDSVKYYGFKVVDAQDNVICETSEEESWCTTKEERNDRLSQFFEVFKTHELFLKDVHDGQLISRHIKMVEDPTKTLVTFSDSDLTKSKVMDLLHLFDGRLPTNGRFRLREIEKIRAKGTAQVKRGEYGQRRLIFQRKLKEAPDGENNVIIDEDFFNLSISIVLPNWPTRFDDEQFKSYLEELIIERVPSHIRANMYWVDAKVMKDFKSLYHEWENLKVQKDKNPDKLKLASYKVYKELKMMAKLLK